MMTQEESKFYIGKLNDRLHGRYPMTISNLKEEILKIPSGFQYVDENTGMMFSGKFTKLMYADFIKDDDMEKIYQYYIKDVKPFIYHDLP